MVVFSLGEFLWSLLAIFFMVIYFMMMFQVIVDVFRRDDASGWKKAGWLIFLLCAPAVGLIAYLVTNSNQMAARNVRSADAYAAAYSNGQAGATAEIERAQRLLESGAITEAEYAQLKQKALA